MFLQMSDEEYLAQFNYDEASNMFIKKLMICRESPKRYHVSGNIINKFKLAETLRESSSFLKKDVQYVKIFLLSDTFQVNLFNMIASKIDFKLNAEYKLYIQREKEEKRQKEREEKEARRKERESSDNIEMSLNLSKVKVEGEEGLKDLDLEKIEYLKSRDNNSGVLVDVDTSTLVRVHADHYLNMLDHKEKKVVIATSRIADVIFDPSKEEGPLEISEDKRAIEINTYVKPKWKTLPPPTTETTQSQTQPEPDPFFFKHLKHLFFDDEEQIDYVLHWIFRCMTGRCGTFLYLISPGQKTGKTLLGNLIRALVGMPNSNVRRSIFENDKFNNYIYRQQFCLLDEFQSHTKKEKDMLKQLTNEFVEVELKGIDAFQQKNTTSFMIANNRLDGVNIEPDDERFSIFETSSIRMEQVFPISEIEHYANRIIHEDTTFLYNIGYYILNRFNGLEAKYSNYKPYVNKSFFKAVKKSAKAHLKQIISRIESKQQEKYSWKDIQVELFGKNPGRRYVSIEDIQYFFEKYKDPTSMNRILDVNYETDHDGVGNYFLVPLNEYRVENDLDELE